MEAIGLRLKQVVKRRQKHYKLAIGDHLDLLRKSLAQDTEQKLQNLHKRSIVIQLDCSKQIDGFSLDNLAEAKVGERIVLTHCKTKRLVARGSIVDIRFRIRIKLQEPLMLFEVEEANQQQDAANEVVQAEDKKGKNLQKFRVDIDKRQVLDKRAQLEDALLKFKRVSCSLPLHKSLLGNYKELSNSKYGKARAISLSSSLTLKGSQVRAVEQSMKKRISLIEGVAGSGKTLVAASLAHSMNRFRNKKILLCSPMQSTVDKLAQLLHENAGEGLRVIKLPESVGKTINLSEAKFSSLFDSDSNNGSIRDCSLKSQVEAAIYERAWTRAERLIPAQIRGTRRQQVRLHRNALRVVKNSSTWLKRRIERKVLSAADVICCTLIQAASPCLKHKLFDMLIIDDLQAASEIDCMIPMMAKGLKQVTLISEMRRDIRMARVKPKLAIEEKRVVRSSSRSSSRSSRTMSRAKSPPVANGIHRVPERRRKQQVKEQMIREAREFGGLFERWLSMGLTAVALRNQFRMHETLAALPNHHFYLSRLRTDEQTNEDLASQIRCKKFIGNGFSWLPNSNCSTAFFNTLTNKLPVDEIVGDIVGRLSNDNVEKSNIAILSNERCSGELIEGVEAGTIEDFFGLERDFVILSCKRTQNGDGKRVPVPNLGDISCDFLKDDEALLRAITRARLGMFIVADLEEDIVKKENCSTYTSDDLFSSQEYCQSWRALVKYYLANKLVIDATKAEHSS